MRVTALLLLIAVAVEAADPAPVHLIRRAGRLPESWYHQQAELWRAQLDADPDDARGWYSLYVAAEYGTQATNGRPASSPCCQTWSGTPPAAGSCPICMHPF